MRPLQEVNVFQLNIQKILAFMNLVKTCRNVPSTSAKNIPMFPIENQQISRKKNSHYINI